MAKETETASRHARGVGAPGASQTRLWRIIAVSVVGGLGLGALSYFGEGPGQPRAVVLLANLTSPWGLTALLLGLWTRSLRRGALLGGTALVVGLTFFYTVTPPIYEHGLRDILWILTAIVVGPLMGLCGAAIRSPKSRSRVAGAAVAGAIFFAEGAWLAFERKMWNYDLTAEPHRYVDLLVVGLLVALAGMVPLALPRPTKLPLVYCAVGVVGFLGATALAGLHWALVRV